MTGKQLKNSILQWAIQGKLVPQDPNDEPASVLLERIRAEKAQLIKEGKIKKDKNESIIYRGDDNSYYEKFLATGEVKCIDDEIPFEIPSGWEWCRLGTLFSHCTGKALNGINKKGKLCTYITTSNLYWDRFEISSLKEMYFTDDELDKCTATKGDLLVCEGGDIGRSAIWNYDYDIRIQNHIHKLRAYLPLCTRFFYYVMFLYKGIGNIGGKGIGIQGLSSGALHNIILPLPSLREQERIVAQIETIIPLAVKYEKSQDELNRLNDDIYTRLRKSTLQEAIQGRLVPQDPNDEPASVLLERIREEKQRLLKEGKLKKKDITDSVIFKGDDNKYYENNSGKIICIDDEIPFEIPSSWAWVRLGCIYNTTSGGTPEKGHPEYYCGGNILWAKVGDLKEWHITDVEERITQIGLDSSSAKLFPTGTLLVAMYCNDAIGKSSIIDVPMSTNQAICGLYPNPYIVTEYVYYVITANKSTLQEKSAGGAQKNINQKIINQLLIPLPPVKEQQRIVNKILNVTSIMRC